MAKSISGKLDGAGLRFAVVVSRFNEFITSRLLAGARDALNRHNVADNAITEIWVPGAWELPLAVKTLADSRKYDAIICLGCVIRGETSHHHYVGGEGIRGIARISTESGIPVGFGILTTDTIDQAVERAGSKAGNKGADAALAALEMVNLLRQIRGDGAK